MKELKTIIISIIGFLIFFLILDYCIGTFFDWAINKMPSEGERVAKSEYVINKVEADFIIIGSSRAEAHYDCKVIQEAFPEYSVFNCGVDGQLFYYINTSFNSILDRNTPKIVIWDFQLKDLVEDKPENLSLLYPYYYKNEYVKNVLDEQDPTLKYCLWNNCYRYNGTATRILRSLRMREQGSMGFLAHPTADASRTFKSNDIILKDQILIDKKVSELEKSILRAKEKNVLIVLCVSPSYDTIIGKSATIICLEHLAKKHNLKFLNFSQSANFVKSDIYWYDKGHLNSRGGKSIYKTNC